MSTVLDDHSCAICLLDWWDGFSHCPDCHRSWQGHAQAHCAGCCRHFLSDSSFDLHLEGAGCRNPATIRARNGRPLFKRTHLKDGDAWCESNLRHAFSDPRGGPRSHDNGSAAVHVSPKHATQALTVCVGAKDGNGILDPDEKAALGGVRGRLTSARR
jgi:hypothetical protein